MGLVTLEMLTGEALPMGGDAWQALRHGVNQGPRGQAERKGQDPQKETPSRRNEATAEEEGR